MLVRDLIAVVQDTLQDNKPPYARWPEKLLVRWINFGQMALHKYLPQLSQRTDVIKLVPGTLQDFGFVPGDRVFGGGAREYFALSRMVRNRGDTGTANGNAIRGSVDRYTKDSLEPNWHAETDIAVREFIVDKDLPTRAWVSPGAVNWTDVWVEVEGMAYPAKIADGGVPGAEVYAPTGGSTTELSVRDQYAEDLHHYVVAMCLLKGSKDFVNQPKSQHHANLFMQSLNLQAQAMKGVSPNIKTLPFAAEEAT